MLIHTRVGRHVPLAVATTALVCWAGTADVGATEHPSLLLTSADVTRVRHTCGAATATDVGHDWGRFGAQAADFQVLRKYFADRPGGGVLPGELLAAAFLHTVDPTDPQDRNWLAVINDTLENPSWVTIDPLEAVLALDWCWPDLAPKARREFLLAMRQRATVFTPADSPATTRSFREKLATLALALAVDEDEDASPSWQSLRTRVLSGARQYFTTTFPRFVEWRGLSPTSPAAAAREESDVALALDLGSRLLQRNLWAEHSDTVARWLEHYVVATVEHPRLDHHFVRDDGSSAPLSPVSRWQELSPITAHLIAARSGDPSAALVAKRVEQMLREATDDVLPLPWRWVPVVLPAPALPKWSLDALPTARNLRGAVVLRGGQQAETTGIWIEAGQPFLRRRQHFDAGHFVVYRGGHLAVGGGDDIAFEALASKQGSQRLGRKGEAFHFEQYFVSTIAHNCVVFWDPARISRWYKARFIPAGGQRCIEGTCTDFALSPAVQKRETARQLAYGHKEDAAYLALDLAPAYDDRVVTSYTREFVFVWGRALVVIDRLALPRSRVVPTWIINIPSRPRVDGEDLRDETRVSGATNDGGVWRYDDASWLRWADGDGCLWMGALEPRGKCLRVVGGPARKLSIGDGRHAGRSYIGGDPDGFEHLVIPAERRTAENAWYRLGSPTVLGPQFGVTPHWGRIEVEPLRGSASVTFVTVLITDRADAERGPTAQLEQAGDTLVLSMASGDVRATLRLPEGGSTGGSVQCVSTSEFTWTFPSEVLPDGPLIAK